MHGVNFTASMIIVFKLTIFNYYFVFLNRQIQFEKVANCVNYKIKLKQSNFERNAKKILGFEHLANTRQLNEQTNMPDFLFSDCFDTILFIDHV
jgi:uncharacterized membrane protein